MTINYERKNYASLGFEPESIIHHGPWFESHIYHSREGVYFVGGCTTIAKTLIGLLKDEYTILQSTQTVLVLKCKYDTEYPFIIIFRFSY